MGSLDGVVVLDLSQGIAGPMAGMLMGDHGADVIKVEPPGGDPTRGLSGAAVWNRGKRSVVLDLEDSAQRARLDELLAGADVLLESFAPAEAVRLGLDYASLSTRFPRLIRTSITGYGRDNPHSERPAIDALVAARSGMHWDQREFFGAPTDRIAGIDLPESPWPVPSRAEQTGHRDGPIFLAHPWPSISAAMMAVMGTGAALLTRERSGRGQLVETSLLQGVLLQSGHLWQKLADPRTPGYRLWYYDRRAPKGLFECSDGGWLHQWPPIDHGFARAAATGTLVRPDEDAARAASPGDAAFLPTAEYEEAVRFQAEANQHTAAAYLRFPRDAWVRVLNEGGRGATPVLSPEEALTDEVFRREGAIVEVDDPDRGRLRQMGILSGFSRSPGLVRGAAPRVGEHTESVLAEAQPAPEATPSGDAPRYALDGIRVLDCGLAMAGPFGPQLLADLGADVIKVHNARGGLDFANWMSVSVERGKRSIAIDLKHPGSREVIERLVGSADVVHHNMRVGVAERLGIDEDTLRPLNPQLIYCHTLGYERDGPRTHLPGTDQMGGALAGTAYEAGGMHAGARPVWHPNSMGDLGNGVLSAIAVIQALYWRERTGEGQRVDGSIVFASLLFNSFTSIDQDGRGPERPRIDAQQTGLGPLYRMYRTRDEWLCVAVTRLEHWQALDRLLDGALASFEFAPPWGAPRDADPGIAAILERAFASESGGTWFARLDAAGVPCEIVSPSFSRELFEDRGAFEREWLVEYDHPSLGQLAQPGQLVNLSETPGRIQRPSPLIGQHTDEILGELGFGAGEIGRLHDAGIVRAAKT
jgi:crotonobetainyl-CoA:carnitine CoA-transferase CaiB-like acyl-CoA transferase